MADDDHDNLTKARKVLIELRYNWAEVIAAGYKRGETETAIKGLIEVQQAIEVIDGALEELEEADDEEDEEEDE
ncbi:hypothetical protein [Bradyrhizobium sp. NP1]|uniref:hypothetical protein n=1 Tax=Bradyrhizobium sp. NP1 TaxID=3049772 RepID=UPI0025A4FF26|nr:hypothetical protein [Bradyrhizobium sp. NP1]WJR77431.1 hypothetical protein QOU61_32675 [Bradyrhizobium sp. NP1]